MKKTFPPLNTLRFVIGSRALDSMKMKSTIKTSNKPMMPSVFGEIHPQFCPSVSHRHKESQDGKENVPAPKRWLQMAANGRLPQLVYS